MANSNSEFARQRGLKASPDAFDQCGGTAIYTFTRGSETFAANDTVNMGPLPAGMVPTGFALAFVRSGTDATLVAQVGLLNSGLTDLDTGAAAGGASWGSTAATDSSRVVNGPVFNQPNAAFYNVQKSDAPRDLGIKFTGAAATPANISKIVLTIEFKPASAANT